MTTRSRAQQQRNGAFLQTVKEEVKVEEKKPVPAPKKPTRLTKKQREEEEAKSHALTIRKHIPSDTPMSKSELELESSNDDSSSHQDDEECYENDAQRGRTLSRPPIVNKKQP